jgi:NAD(P)-dependent dehydrogenase (short-subunit alcohol dehydrogenase family)
MWVACPFWGSEQPWHRIFRRPHLKIHSPVSLLITFCVTGDIRESEKVEAFVRNVLKKFGRIDCLVNNAGGQFLTTAEGVTPKFVRLLSR